MKPPRFGHAAMLSTDLALSGWNRAWRNPRPGQKANNGVRRDWVIAPWPQAGLSAWSVMQVVDYVPLEWRDRVFVLRRHATWRGVTL